MGEKYSKSGIFFRSNQKVTIWIFDDHLFSLLNNQTKTLSSLPMKGFF